MDTCSYPLEPLWANPVYTVVHMYGIALVYPTEGREPLQVEAYMTQLPRAACRILRARIMRARARAQRARVYI